MKIFIQVFTYCLLLLMSTTHSTVASEANACAQYAKQSVIQHISNVKGDCDLTGAHWSPRSVHHQKWCEQAPITASKKIIQYRHQQLSHCGRIKMRASFEWSDLPYRIKNNLTAELISAIQSDDLNSLIIFEQHGADLGFDWQLTQGGLLYWAISHQASSVTHYLMEKKQANPNLSRNGGPNPLVNLLNHVPNVNYRLLSYLLQRGANPNHGGEDFSEASLPLPVATANDDLQSVRLLLKHQANPNLFEYIPPLIMAIEQNNKPLVEALLGAGANPNIGLNHLNCQVIKHEQLSGSYLPLDTAKKAGNTTIVNMISNAGGQSSRECLLATN